MDIRQVLSDQSRQPLTHQWLMAILKDYKYPNDKVHDLVQQKWLEPIKRGIYIVGPALDEGRPEPFLLANHILGPSYVSVETALSYHGLIPERVYEIASMTVKASRRYSTTVGMFTYTKLPLPYYSFGIEQWKLTDQQYVMGASAEKALCDKIVTTSRLVFRSRSEAKEWLLSNMRIEEGGLKGLDVPAIRQWLADAPKRDSLEKMIETIELL